jgi:hypothetical protein
MNPSFSVDFAFRAWRRVRGASAVDEGGQFPGKRVRPVPPAAVSPAAALLTPEILTMISFSSAACGKKLKVKDELAGKKVKCPGCG